MRRLAITVTVLFCCLVAALTGLSAKPALAQQTSAPFSINYSGRLTTATGAPVEGPVNLQLKMYRGAAGTDEAPINIPLISGVPLVSGVFTVAIPLQLGDLGTVFDGADDTWVEVTDTVNHRTYPKQKFLAVPYALKVPVDNQSIGFTADGVLQVKPAGVLPADSGAANTFLTTDGAGHFSWAPPSTSASSLAGVPLSMTTPLATGQLLRYDGANWVPSADTSVNKNGDSGVGSLTLANQSTLGLGTFAADPTGLQPEDKGKTWFNTTTNQIKYWDGGAAQVVGASGAGLTNLNGASGNTQMFGTPGVAGTAPNWVTDTASNTHTLNIPLASAAGTAAGLLTNGDYTVFNGKQAPITAASTLSAGTLTTAKQDGLELKPFSTGAGQTGELRFDELAANGGTYVGFKAPDSISSSKIWTLPGADGAAGQLLKTDGAGTLSWAAGAAPTGAAGGDLSGTFPNPGVAAVGGVSAANVASGASAANAATNANTASALVKRDASGNFSAGTITANLVGNASTAANFSGSLAGDVTGPQGTTVVAQVGAVSAANVASGANAANAATNANTASTIVKRDGSGNFTAGTVTANLIGNVTGNASTATSATNFSGSLTGDVTGTQGATVVGQVGGVTAANVASGANAANAATAAATALTIVSRDLNGNLSTNQITATPPNSASQGLVVKGVASQAANLEEWQDVNGKVLAAVDKSGYLKFKDSDGTDNYLSLKAAPTMAADLTYTFPGSVTAGNFLTTDASGNLSWAAPSSFSGSFTGDVTGTQSATVVAQVGSVSAANVASGANAANAATNANTASTLVKRDGSGNFTAGTVTANLVGNVTGNASTATSATNFSGNLAGDVTGPQGTTAVALVGGATAANVALGANAANAATNANTASTIVKRDGSGNFTAGTITAALSGNATTATTATNFSGSLAGDVTGPQGTTAVALVGGVTAANVALGANAANAATNANTASTLVKRDGSGNFSAGTITANLVGNASTASSFSGSLAGDVTGPQGTTVVAQVGAVTAANVALGANAANAATNANTASTLVKRDGSGNFTAGTVTANLIGDVTGNAATATSATNFSGSLTGDVTGTQGATVVGQVGGVTAANVASGANAANAATAAATALTIVSRDLNGSFSANQIIATPPNSASQGLIVKGVTSQTGNLEEWQDVNGKVLAAVDKSGYLKLKDSDGTDNYLSLKAAPTMASDLTYTFPAAPSAGNFLTTDASGNLSWAAPGSFSGSFTGDVTGTQGATVVDQVGSVSAANVASGANTANAATNANTASTLVKRDGSGNFTAGTITANLVGNVTGNASTATSATNFSGNLAGDVTGPQGTTAVALVGGATAANVALGANAANAATNANTASTLVKRDGSGNFTAGTITAALSGNATTATTATNFSGSLAGDVTGPQGTTAVALVGGATAANVALGANAANAATNANTASTIIKRDGSGNFSAGTITANLVGNASTASSFSGSLAGDVTGPQGTTVVAQVGAVTAANVALGANAANAATNANTASTLVKRDGSGNFTAGTITANLVGNVTGNASSTTNFSGNLAGDVTGPQGTTAVALVGGATAANVASGATAANAATNANTASTIVKRDGSGNFTAGTITAALIGNATNVTGTVAATNGGTGISSTATFPTSGVIVTEAATETLTNKTLTSPTINTPTVSGGTHNSLTGFSLRDTSAAFDVTVGATSSTTLTAGRTMTLDLANANRTLALRSNLQVDTGAVTLSGQAGGSAVTLPTSGTLATLAGTETWTNKTLTSPSLSGATLTGASVFGAGDGTGSLTAATLRGPAAVGSNIAGVETTFDASNGTGTGGSGGLTFRTAPAGTTGSSADTLAPAMRIANSGNVGIGTTSPAEVLEVNGGLKMGTTATACDASHRGSMKFDAGGSGVPDKLSICLRSYDNVTYVWTQVIQGINCASGSQTVSYTGAIVNFTVPSGCSTLVVEVWGAQGGTGNGSVGGLGAYIKGTISTSGGTVYKVLVGQKGGNSASYPAGGGGGGSFVTDNSNSPIMIGGGGGGGGTATGQVGQTTTSGGTAGAAAGGTAGGGGAAANGSNGGGGLTGNGSISSGGYTATSAKSFVNGGAGSAGGSCAAGGGAGGFGGGSGGEYCSQGSAGAGGGYSGGGGANAGTAGSGGGSYNGGTSQTNTAGVDAASSGNGKVVFTYQ